MFERRLYHHVDWLLLAAIGVLIIIGLAMIYSTTYDALAGQVRPLFYKQLAAVGIGLVALLICMAVDYRTWAEHSLLIFGLVAASLVYVLFFGDVGGGARRWIGTSLGNIQPSEFAKIALALVLSAFFSESRRGAENRGDLALAGAFLAVFLGLIAREPDLGSAVALLPIFGGVVFMAGLRLRMLAIVTVVAVLATPVVWTYALEDYQRGRISTFVNPSMDPRGAGYQQIQARITVGSGGLSGKGFLQGTQGQYKFLPVAHNDFIYSVLAEEHGFIGVLVTLGLYLFVIVRSLEAARLAKDRLGGFLVVGLLSGFTFQVIYNVTMSAGLAPVKGLTLPLMSYGGSSVIATLASFGLILNVRMRRFTN